MASIKLIGMNGHRIVPCRGGYRLDGGDRVSLAEAVNTARHEDDKGPLTPEEIADVKEAYREAQIDRGQNRKPKRYV